MITVQYIVVLKPSMVRSILEDTFTFGGFILLLFFNHRYLSGNGWIDALFILLWIYMAAMMQSSRYHKFETKEEAVKFLEGKNV